MKTYDYDVCLKHGSGWSYFDVLNMTEDTAKHFTRTDYVLILAKDKDEPAIREVERADGFKLVKVTRR